MAHALRHAGLVCMAFSVIIALASPQMRAGLAAPWLTPLRRFVAIVTVSSPSPSPSPTPSSSPSPGASATPGPQMARGGPLHFSLTGGLSMGTSERSTTQGEINNSATQTSENAGLMARIERDTSSTRLVATMPIGLTLQRGTFGLPQLAYYAPKYGIAYGPQSLGVLGGVPIGSTLRGFSFIVPIPGSGEATFYQGPALGAEGQTFNLFGVLARTELRSTLVEAGLTSARTAQGNSVQALLLGGAHSGGALSQSFEASIERPRASAFQYLANVSGNSISGAFTLRHISEGFLNFGAGTMQGQNLAEATVQDSLGSTTVSLDEALQTTSSQGFGTSQRRGQFYLTHSFTWGGSTALSFSEQRQTSAQGVSWTGGPSLQVSLPLLGMQTVLSGQWTRSTSQFAAPTASVSYTGQFSRQIGLFNASLSYNAQKQLGALQSYQGRTLFSFGRTMGATSLALNAQVNKVVSAGTDTTQIAPTVTVARQLSPALAVGLNYGMQYTRDPVNPMFNGHSRVFSVQISAPFALGNGAVIGRVDPRLPATISGSVVSESDSSQLPFSANMSNGLANVAVVLDNQTVARTDLSGHFQFNSVAPGAHQLRVESTSLPRGVLVDQPYASISVLGGQQGTVTFGVGSFGVIQGHVSGTGSDGEQMPLDNVTISLDGTRTTQTDMYGGYGFGRLSAGTHTLQIVAGSIPASVGFPASETKKEVSVVTGRVSDVNFLASPLGSIQGKVTYDPLLAPDYTGGVFNAYVVAEPGDYAVITDVDGSYYMDNLPAGTYTLSVDPETVPPNTGNRNGPVTVVLGGGEHKEGIDFTIARRLKAVVFTFQSGSGANVTSLTVSDHELAPRGATQVTVDGVSTAKSVAVRAFGQTQPLHYDARSKAWIGLVTVPAKTPKGSATIVAEIDGKPRPTVSAQLEINPDAPLVIFTMIPRYPRIGQTVSVRARFLTQVAPGDRIRWLDGQLTQLSRPVTGRVYQFTVKISEQPMRGFLLTRQGELPITLR